MSAARVDEVAKTAAEAASKQVGELKTERTALQSALRHALMLVEQHERYLMAREDTDVRKHEEETRRRVVAVRSGEA